MTGPSLEARRMKILRQGRAVVEDFSLRLERGRLVCLVGPNGAGKSTALRALCGLTTPDAGEILLDGRPLHAVAPRERARTIGYLAQERTIGWNIPVRELIALGRLPHGDRLTAVDEAAIEDSLRDTRMEPMADRAIETLSGGERALALLARALAVKAPWLLADEPMAGLDIRHQLAIMARLREQRDRGVGVLIVIHDLSLAAQFCDHVIVMHEGRIVAEGPPTDALTPSVLHRAFGVRTHLAEHDGQRFILPLVENGQS
jgi:iron complex transport system ATP-binding protein